MMDPEVRLSPIPLPMRSFFSPRLFSATSLQASALLILAASTTHAASSTFIGGGATTAYSDATNWQGGIVPGLGTGTPNGVPTAAQQNADIATFDSGTLTTAQTVMVTQNYSIGGLHFVAGAAAYILTSGTNSYRFYVNSGGSVLVDPGVTTAQNIVRTGQAVGVNGGNSTTYENDSTTTAATLTIGSFNNGISGAGTVILTGTNTGANAFANSSNVITDGSSPLSFIKNGAGTWSIGASGTAQTFTGGVTINNGTLRFGGGGTANTALGTGTLTINGGTLATNSSTARTLSNPLVLGAGATFGDATGTGTLGFTNATVTLSASTTLTVNQATSIAGAIGGSGFSVTKGGTSTLTLGAPSTYTGGTTVTAGILSVTANGALGTGNVTVSGGVLSLTATVTNGIADNAILRLAGGGVANQADTGAIELLGTTTETVAGLFLNGVAQLPGVYNSTTSSDYITGTGSITVVPEPSTWALGLLGGLSILACGHFKKRSSAV